MTGAGARRALPVVALLASGFSLGSALRAAWEEGRTYDEAAHLTWARRLYEDRVSERRSTPLFNSKTPVTVLNVMARQAARRSLGVRDTGALRFASRLPSVAWLAALLAATFAWTRALAGRNTASLAVVLLALDPNLIAHASVATVDVAYAVATLAVLAACFWCAERPGLRRGAVLGAAIGFAFAVKFTAIVLAAVALLAALPVLAPALRKTPRQVLAAAATATLAAVAVIDLAYALVGVGEPLGDQPWTSPLMHGLVAAVPGLRAPVPLDFLTGLDMLVGAERGRAWNVVALGRLYPNGVWFYFGLLWLLKTPLGLIALVAIGLSRVRRALAASAALRFLAVAFVLHVAYFSLVFRTQVGYRYVLMCLPPLAMLAAIGLAPLLTKSTGARVATLLLFGSVAAGQWPYLGNPLAYTNLLIWPKTRAFRFIADSNIDWGQNDEKIGGWIAERGLVTHLNPAHLLPGSNTLDLNLAAGVSGFERYRWLRENLTPVGQIGHTHLLFDVPEEAYRRFLDEARLLQPLPIAARLCGPPPVAFLAEPELLRLPEPAEGRLPVACFAAATATDLTLALEAGSLVVLRPGQPLRAGESLEAGQQLTYRLAPGLHALILGRARDAQGRWRTSAPLRLRIGTAAVDRRGLPSPTG